VRQKTTFLAVTSTRQFTPHRLQSTDYIPLYISRATRLALSELNAGQILRGVALGRGDGEAAGLFWGVLARDGGVAAVVHEVVVVGVFVSTVTGACSRSGRASGVVPPLGDDAYGFHER